jgi:hypothetical protein
MGSDLVFLFFGRFDEQAVAQETKSDPIARKSNIRGRPESVGPFLIGVPHGSRTATD